MIIHPDLRGLLEEHPFFEGLPGDVLETVAGCASNVRFDVGQRIAREGESADAIYLLRRGRVALELRIHHAPVVVKTLGPGELLGFNWLFEDHRWHYDVRAVEVTRAVALDGACLRRKCEADHSLGFELLRRFAQGIEEELYRTRLQLVDVYGPAGG